MDSIVKILQKYISLTEKNKSSHWKYYLNSKSNFYNINNSLGLGSYNKKNLKKIIHYFLSRITYGRYIFLTSSFRRYKKIYDKNKRQIDTDCIRHIYTFDLLRKKIKKNTIKKICIIGDGKVNSLIGCLLHYPKAKIYSINLAETLIQDYLIYKKMNPRMAKKIQVVERERDLMNNKRIFLIPSCLKNYLYKKKINLFINIASFQEMQIAEIKRYFKIIKSNKCYLYCANREHKRLPDGKIISFNKYPFGKGKKLILEDCSWHQKFYQFTYPFIRKYEGNIKHCLLSYK